MAKTTKKPTQAQREAVRLLLSHGFGFQPGFGWAPDEDGHVFVEAFVADEDWYEIAVDGAGLCHGEMTGPTSQFRDGMPTADLLAYVARVRA